MASLCLFDLESDKLRFSAVPSQNARGRVGTSVLLVESVLSENKFISYEISKIDI